MEGRKVGEDLEASIYVDCQVPASHQISRLQRRITALETKNRRTARGIRLPSSRVNFSLVIANGPSCE